MFCSPPPSRPLPPSSPYPPERSETFFSHKQDRRSSLRRSVVILWASPAVIEAAASCCFHLILVLKWQVGKLKSPVAPPSERGTGKEVSLSLRESEAAGQWNETVSGNLLPRKECCWRTHSLFNDRLDRPAGPYKDTRAGIDAVS